MLDLCAGVHRLRRRRPRRDDVDNLRACVAHDHNCADVCELTGVLSRPANGDHYVVHRLLQAYVRACVTCADECARHADHHRHCGICEKACRACGQACRALLNPEVLEELVLLALP
jgi:hypothetical protein